MLQMDLLSIKISLNLDEHKTYVNMKLSIFFTFLFSSLLSFSQIGATIPTSRTIDWTISGYQGEIPDDSDYDVIVNITEPPYNVDNTGASDITAGVQQAINDADESLLTMIFFPPGTYKMDGKIILHTKKNGTAHNNDNNIVLKGSGQYHTVIKINSAPVGAANYFEFLGDVNATEASIRNITGGYSTGSSVINISSEITDLIAGDFVEFFEDPVPEAEWNPWGCNGDEYEENHPVGQIVQVQSVSGTEITFVEPIGIYANSDRNPQLRKIYPVANSGIENMSLLVEDDAQSGRKTITFEYAINCFLRGAELAKSKSTHVILEHSAHITIHGCYIHDVGDYNDNYGVSSGTQLISRCLIENNVITKTRHSVVLSGSTYGNVVGYNFANESYLAIKGTTKPKTDEAAADLLLHGYYPTATLFEGNVSTRLHSDEYGGYQGKYNTFFRNMPYKDPQTLQIWGNISTNILGNHNYPIVNLMESCNDPIDVAHLCVDCPTLSDHSYYRLNRPVSFLSDQFYSWPPIGPPISGGSTSTNSNPAEYRYSRGAQQCDHKRSSLVGYSVKNRGLLTAINSVVSNEGKLVRNQNEYSIGRYSVYSESNPFETISHVTTARLSGGTGQEEIIYVINNPLGGTEVYITTNKILAPGTPPVFSQPSGEITAITSGDFSGTGFDEIIIGYLDGTNKPFIFKSDDPTDLMKETIYSNPSVYWRIEALTTGDFTDTGDDELVVGFNSTGLSSAIYRSEDASDVGIKIWEDLSGYWNVDALAAGDFNDDGIDELIEGFNSTDGPAIYKIMNGLDSPPISLYNGSNYWELGALAAGDFDADGDDELVSAFNSDAEGPNIYKSELAINANAVPIFNSHEIYWNVHSLAIEKCPGYYDQNGVCDPLVYNQGGGNYAPIDDSIESEDNLDSIVTEVNQIRVFPNPSNGYFTIEFYKIPESSQHITIYDPIGNVVFKSDIATKSLEIDLSNTPSGIYIIQVDNGVENIMKKIVKL